MALGDLYFPTPGEVGKALRQSWSILLPVVGTNLLSSILIGLGMLFFIIPGIYLIFSYWLSPQLMVVERVFGMAALRRSSELMTDNKWRGFVIGLVVVASSASSVAAPPGPERVSDPQRRRLAIGAATLRSSTPSTSSSISTCAVAARPSTRAPGAIGRAARQRVGPTSARPRPLWRMAARRVARRWEARQRVSADEPSPDLSCARPPPAGGAPRRHAATRAAAAESLLSAVVWIASPSWFVSGSRRCCSSSQEFGSCCTS